MKKIALLFILLPLISIGSEVITLAKKELKVFSSYFSNGNKKFTDTYLDGDYHEWRERVNGGFDILTGR